MKCFYLFTDDGQACFDCGETPKIVLGYFTGKPNAEIMAKLAKRFLPQEVVDKFDQMVKVGDFWFAVDDGWNKTFYDTETFELEEL